MSELFWRAVGSDDAPTVVFCHGLFGQGKNWGNVAKALSDAYRCVMVDMPNHGRSPWRDEVSYPAMAEEVVDFLTDDQADHLPITLVGHSMGGKIAMRVALARPDLVSALAVVDMSPTQTMHATRAFDPLIRGMLDLDLPHLTGRSEADHKLRASIPNDTVRAFLMQNLRHELHPKDGRPPWRWQMNLQALADHRQAIGEWPTPPGTTFNGPTIWIAGSRSHYVLDEHSAAMRALFPRVRKVVIKDAGHWVHSEQPETFIATLRHFLNDNRA